MLLGLHVSWTIWNVLGMLITWGLQAYAYVGILDQAANASTAGGSSSSSSLVGGAHLDLLAITLLVQYGTVLHSTKWYWVLALVPIWGGWKLYTTFGGGGKKKVAPSSSATEDPGAKNDANADKRQKRSEKRRQKWS
jgi:hypothetical protein